MTKLTNTQKGILDSLMQAILHGNLLEVRNIFKDNEDSNIQKILRVKWTSNELIDNVLSVAIDSYNIHGQKGGIEIIELIWQKADQGTRDFLCREEYNLAAGGSVNVINMLRDLQEQGRTDDSNEVIQEMEEHKRVMALDHNLRKAIMSLNVNQVKAALEDCGEDIEKVLMRRVYWNGAPGIDYLLTFPLEIECGKKSNKENMEERKKITKLLWDKASPDVRDFWLERPLMVDKEGQNTRDNYVIYSLEMQQRRYANVVDEGWLEDLVQEIENYKTNRENELSKPELAKYKEEDCAARVDEGLAKKLQQQYDLENDADATLENNGTSLPGDEQENTVGATTVTSTNDNKTPEKNDTTFWSEHKRKIALGATVVCTAGAVAAYVLAYPAVALALAVLAAVILMGAGIAKVLEDPSVEGLSTSKEQRA